VIYGITDLTTFILGTIFIVLLPGPNSLYVMTLASRHGIAAGYRAAAGIFTGDTILMLLTVTGAASVLYASPAVFTGLKIAGALYLAWIGIGLVRAGWNTWNSRGQKNQVSDTALNAQTNATTKAASETLRDSSGKKLNFKNPFRTAMVISLLNPKAIMFFLSFFIQFVDPQYPHPELSFFILGVIVQIISVLYMSALIWGGARLATTFNQHPALSSASTGVIGLLFIAFAIKLTS